jgi:hypothetical protein
MKVKKVYQVTVPDMKNYEDITIIIIRELIKRIPK